MEKYTVGLFDDCVDCAKCWTCEKIEGRDRICEDFEPKPRKDKYVYQCGLCLHKVAVSRPIKIKCLDCNGFEMHQI